MAHHSLRPPSKPLEALVDSISQYQNIRKNVQLSGGGNFVVQAQRKEEASLPMRRASGDGRRDAAETMATHVLFPGQYPPHQDA